jgi:tryptophan synthase beta chain
MNQNKWISADEKGFFGDFGGAYIPEMLQHNMVNLQKAYRSIVQEETFQKRFHSLLNEYTGRPTPLSYAESLSKELGITLYLKREDLNHTGAHKITNAIGQALLAKELGKDRIIAETGAGQHGVATATACALLDLECTVFMGARDIERQAPNVKRMKMLGAKVEAVNSGSQTLKDATNEAIRHWINHPNDTHYIIGSTVGPHPYPEMVAYFQSVISKEIKQQLNEKDCIHPDRIIACIGGGSNAAGTFYHYLEDDSVELIGVEAGGKGLDSGKTAASISRGTPGILHGSKSMILQDEEGQIREAHSISAGLDYPGIGPMHAFWAASDRMTVLSASDEEAIEAAQWMARSEGIIPALETAHAIAALKKIAFKKGEVVVLGLSGRGDKDMETYSRFL